MSRTALSVLVLLLLGAFTVAAWPDARARQLALVFKPGTSAEAMGVAAFRLGLLPIASLAPWPVLIAAPDGEGWRGSGRSADVLLIVATDGFAGCLAKPAQALPSLALI